MSEEIKVLSLVSYKFLPPDMGGQKGIAFFNRYLSRELKLCCVTIKSNNKHTTEGYPVKNIISDHKLRYINPLIYFSLRKIIKEEKITHLIIEHPYYGWLGILLKWLCKVRLIVHSHNIESTRFKTLGKWWWGVLWHYEKFTHNKADHSFFIHDDDRNYAIENFKLKPVLCSTITYGFELETAPAEAEIEQAKQQICTTHQISGTDKILLFNGTLGYKPNLDALDIILKEINPILLAEKNFNYKIIICGSKLPASYQGLINYKERNIIYAGFVDDINLYFKGCSLFINPVLDGGGIKTKLVEALGYNLSVISTASGATGIPVELTGGKLKILNESDWLVFAKEIINANEETNTPPAYFKHFYWGNIAQKAATAVKNLI